VAKPSYWRYIFPLLYRNTVSACLFKQPGRLFLDVQNALWGQTIAQTHE
jgi:hypothetical protein